MKTDPSLIALNRFQLLSVSLAARTLHRILEWRKHKVPWPSVRLPITELINHITKRVNEASGTYQMFGVLGDIVILTK